MDRLTQNAWVQLVAIGDKFEVGAALRRIILLVVHKRRSSVGIHRLAGYAGDLVEFSHLHHAALVVVASTAAGADVLLCLRSTASSSTNLLTIARSHRVPLLANGELARPHSIVHLLSF